MTTVLVLGSNSPLGASFCAHAHDAGWRVIATSRSDQPLPVFLPYKWKSRPHLEFVQLDLNSDVDLLKSLMAENRPRYVVNFASQAMVAQSWENPTHWMQTNVVAMAAVLEVLRCADFLDRYIHYSTPEVYGSTSGWTTEHRNYAPSTPYALSRAAGDMEVTLWNQTYQLPAIITRSANIYGEGQQLFRIIPRTILCCLLGQKLPLDGGGLSERSFAHFDDLSAAVMMLCERGTNGEDYHLSPHSSISIRDLVRKICDITKSNFDDVVQMSPGRLGNDQAYLLESSKIRDQIGWTPRISIDAGLERCVAWCRENLEVLRHLPQVYRHKP